MPHASSRGPAVLFSLLAALALCPPQTAHAAGPPRSTIPVSHSALTSLLRTYVRPSPDGINRVDFTRFKSAGRDRLKTYLAALQRAAPSAMPRQAQLAYWINLYNAKTLEIVLDRYPVSSIKDIRLPDPAGKPSDGPWKAEVMNVEGRALSLDDIDNKILRVQFRDPRIHYALNCLSVGCPNLQPEAFVPERLDRQLDAAATAFVNHPRAVSIKAARVEASSIYDWYAADFGGFKGTMAHLSRYARPELRRQLASVKKIDAYDYDWRLIDSASR